MPYYFKLENRSKLNIHKIHSKFTLFTKFSENSLYSLDLSEFLIYNRSIVLWGVSK